MTDYTNVPAELMAIHVAIQIFLDRYEDSTGPIVYDSMTKLSENIIQCLKKDQADNLTAKNNSGKLD